jgi:hypothetical protein
MFRGALRKLGAAWGRFKDATAERASRLRARFVKRRIKLSYFDQVLAVERLAIDERRRVLAAQDPTVRPYEAIRQHEEVVPAPKSKPPVTAPRLTDPPGKGVNPHKLEPGRMRPEPIPCTAVGLALSGGGIRSAAFSLGALQAFDSYHMIHTTDYLSTVSGGGYAGTSLTAGMSVNGGKFPFGGTSDVRDNDAIGHLRNYSNYLMPRARSALRNSLDVAAIVLRGLLANAVVVLTFLIIAAFITYGAYPQWQELSKGNFVFHLPHAFHSLLSLILPAFLSEAIGAVIDWCRSTGVGIAESRNWGAVGRVFAWLVATPFTLTILLAVALAIKLIVWALRRSRPVDNSNDVDSRWIRHASWLLGATILSALLDLQPLLISGLGSYYEAGHGVPWMAGAVAIGAAIVISVFASRLAAFLEATQLSASSFVRTMRAVTQVSLIAASLVMPIALFAVYWHLSAWLIGDNKVPTPFDEATMRTLLAILLIPFIPMTMRFDANAYSLHQFYKDRLSKAFLFDPTFRAGSDPEALLHFKLSKIETALCPYLIVNTALNVQGSKEANRRGRDADFFTFTRDFVGSDLTHFAPTSAPGTSMERIDQRLDLGSAMAISGAAISANMGSNTVRWLSPTLALLNIRLGYWLRNPRDLGKRKKLLRPREWVVHFLGKFYLPLEMFNLLDEEKGLIYLSDGGHIENLGIYQLLKRGCRLIFAVDAEADPEISCASLLKLERFARIDLGVRIILPWEQIAEMNRSVNLALDPRASGQARRLHGPHCAVGRILYEDGTKGVLVYFKSSLSGDEKDYVLDYKKRNRSFPHENTSDQFFTEEQFEAYRTLGFHVVDGFFSGHDKFSYLDGLRGWPNEAEAKLEVWRALGKPVVWTPPAPAPTPPIPPAPSGMPVPSSIQVPPEPRPPAGVQAPANG